MENICFKEWLWKKSASEIKQLQSDDGVFIADMLRGDYQEKYN